MGIIWVGMHLCSSMSDTWGEFTYTVGYLVSLLRFGTITGKHATLMMLMQTISVSVYKSFFVILAVFILLLCYSFFGVILFG